MLKFGNVIGISVTASTVDEVADEIFRRARRRDSGYVCIANVHMLTLARQDRDLRRVLQEATIVTSDGMPLVWDLRRQGFRGIDRVAGPDLMNVLCRAAAEQGVCVYFYGGQEETMSLMVRRLRKRYPDLPIGGYERPPKLPVRPELDPRVVSRIRESGAGIVFVGLGCPKQEFWMTTHAAELNGIAIGVGAAFDFEAGVIPRAPVWMQRGGLEWLFRCATEPRRLWKRYLVSNSLFLFYLFMKR